MEDAGGSAVAPAKEKKNTNELFPLRVSRKPSFPLTLSLPPPKARTVYYPLCYFSQLVARLSYHQRMKTVTKDVNSYAPSTGTNIFPPGLN